MKRHLLGSLLITILMAIGAIAIIVVTFLQQGCAYKTWTPECRHTASMAALVAQEDCPDCREMCTEVCTGILFDRTGSPVGPHAQARAWRQNPKSGEFRWVWLKTFPGDVVSDVTVREWGKDEGFVVTRCRPSTHYIWSRFFMREGEK